MAEKTADPAPYVYCRVRSPVGVCNEHESTGVNLDTAYTKRSCIRGYHVYMQRWQASTATASFSATIEPSTLSVPLAPHIQLVMCGWTY